MATREEIDALKADWLEDQCWEIEDTGGFEEHREELLAFRLAAEAGSAERYRMKLEATAKSLGIPGDLASAEKVTLDRRKAGDCAESATALLAAYLDVADADGKAELGQIVENIVDAAVSTMRAEMLLESARLEALLLQCAGAL